MAFNEWFRRNQKKVYIVMIFAMGAWGIGSSAIYLIPQKAIGTIGGEKITRDQLADFEIRWRRILLSRYQGPVMDLVWKQLIYEREANKSGIIVTDDDITKGIQDFAAQILGERSNVSNEQLVRLLCNTFNVNRDQLFRTIKEVSLISKLDFFLKNSIKITNEEAWQRYALENEQVKIKYVSFNAADYVDTVNVNDDEIKEFYNKYKDVLPDKMTGSYGYKEPDKIKVEYIMANYNIIANSKVDVTDDEVLKYYEDNKEVEFKQVAKKEPVSDDKANEKEGANDTDSSSETVQFRPLEDVKNIIIGKLKNQRAKELANELITKVDDEVYENLDKLNRPSFKELAEKYGLTYNIAKSPTKKSEFISREEAERMLIGPDRFASIAFEREKNDPSSPLSALEGRYIFQVVEKKVPETPPLSEVYEKVKSDLKLEKAFRKTRELAEQCLNKMKETSFEKGIESFVAESGIKNPESGETGYLKRPRLLDNRPQGYVAALKAYRPNVVSKAFALKDASVELAVEEEGKKASYLITLVDKKEAQRQEFDEKLDQIRRQYVAEKQRYVVSKWEKNIFSESQLDI